MNSSAREERADTLITLAILFDRRFAGDQNDQGRPISEVVADSLDALDDSRRKSLLKRTAQVESFTESQRNEWLGRSIDNIRRRGRSTKLDTNIHPEQIARVLKREPLSIRRNILGYLPLDLSSEVAFLLGLNEGIDAYSVEPSQEIIEVVKHHFLNNFVQIESVHDAGEVDNVSVAELPKFIHELGLREIAVACRGIRSRETVAAFLCRFAEDDAKAIAMYLSGLERVDPALVSSADDTVRRLWSNRLRTRQNLHMIGLDVLAAVFVQRTETAVRYTAQKLPYRDSVRWRKMILARETSKGRSNQGALAIERKRAEKVRLIAVSLRDKETA